jgi:hypothetical protein
MEGLMSYEAVVYRILVASPGDVAPERAAVTEVIGAWNALHSADTGAVLLPVLWETHASPEMGDRPQAIINKQLVRDCDLLVGIFWTRIGTHTGVAESGTVEEIEEFLGAGKPVLLYFSSSPVVLDSIDEDQYRRLKEFRDQMEGEGLVDRYTSVAQFRERLMRHLLTTVRDKLAPRRDRSAAPGRQASTLSDPAQELQGIAQQLQSLVVRRERDWVTERDVQPMRLDDAKQLLRTFAAELLSIAALLDGRVDTGIMKVLEEGVTMAKALQQHRVHVDGGKSSNAFWVEGDRLFQSMNHLVSAVQSYKAES